MPAGPPVETNVFALGCFQPGLSPVHSGNCPAECFFHSQAQEPRTFALPARSPNRTSSAVVWGWLDALLPLQKMESTGVTRNAVGIGRTHPWMDLRAYTRYDCVSE